MEESNRNHKRRKDLDFAHVMPQAPDMEKAVLGALMIDKDAYLEVCDLLRPESFYEPRNQMVYEAIQAGEKLAEMGINARIINMSTIKPLDEALVLKAAKECGRVITCEEHSVIGGLGEAVCSFLSETYPTPVKRIGVNDEFGFSGPAYEVLDAFGLCADNIVKVTKEFLGK